MRGYMYIKYHILLLPCSSEARDNAHGTTAIWTQRSTNIHPSIHRARHWEVLAAALPSQYKLTQQLYSKLKATTRARHLTRALC